MKAVFFDFGGTLADREGGYWSAMVKDVGPLFGMGSEELRAFFRDELCVVPLAEELEYIRKRCREKGLPPENADKFMDLKESFAPDFRWEPNAIEVVEALKEKGVVTGIISNTDGNGGTIYDSMKPDIRPYLDILVLSSEERIAKPDTKLFEVALERTGVKAEDAMYVGDKEDRDISAPHELGMKAVLYDPRGEHEKTDADYVIKDLKEVLELI